MTTWRHTIKTLLASPGGNLLLRGAVAPLRRALPRSILDRLPYVGSVRVAVPGGRVVEFVSDGRDWIVARIHWSGPRAFEPETLAVFDALLPRMHVFYDVGAYSGWYAVRAAAAGHRPAVHAFEAVPATYERLVLHTERNQLENLRPVWAAVGAVAGETEIHVPEDTYLPTSASTRAGFRPRTRALRVPALRLDDYCRDGGMPPPDFLKLDVEGEEPAVLEGGRHTIAGERPLILCEVLAGLTEVRLREFFAPLEYASYHVAPGGLVPALEIRGDPSYRAMNFLFVPRERAAEVERHVARGREPAAKAGS